MVGFLLFLFSSTGHPVSLIHSRLFLPILKQDVFDGVMGFSENLLLEYMESSFVVFWSTLGRSMMNFLPLSFFFFLNLLFPFLCDLDGHWTERMSSSGLESKQCLLPILLNERGHSRTRNVFTSISNHSLSNAFRSCVTLGKKKCGLTVQVMHLM